MYRQQGILSLPGLQVDRPAPELVDLLQGPLGVKAVRLAVHR